MVSRRKAQIIEDWFSDGASEDKDKDIRYYYVKKHIRGKQLDYDWLLPRVEPLPKGTLDVKVQTSFNFLLPILAKRYSESDTVGYGSRAKELSLIFQKFEDFDARTLHARLLARRPGDQLAKYFYENLSTLTRNKLLAILRDRF